jgi:hypothetical protein
MTSPTPKSRGKTVVLWIIAVGIMVPGGVGFFDKLIQFFRTFASDEAGGFTLVPIMNYLLVAAGFICLLIWAVARGMFRDIEGPKYTMLEREARLERSEGRQWSDEG